MTYISFVPCPLGPQEINGLRVPPCDAYKLLTDHLITGLPLKTVVSTCNILAEYVVAGYGLISLPSTVKAILS